MKIGILGGGQLGMMLAQAGIKLGHSFYFYSDQADVPAKKLGPIQVGAYNDSDQLQKFLDSVDVLTYEFEHLPVDALNQLKPSQKIFPSLKALQISQNRSLEKKHLNDCGIATAHYFNVTTISDIEAAIQKLGLPLLLKTSQEGYDGKGQKVVHTLEEAHLAFASLKPHPLIAEEIIRFNRELSVIGARDLKGNILFYPLVESHHRHGILRKTISPAPHLNPVLEAAAKKALTSLFETFAYVGVLTLELFDCGDKILANEIAPRVHNSGHWSIEGAETSQFENHIRAISGMELASTQSLGHSLMYNCVGLLPQSEKIKSISQMQFHSYDKAARPGRKLGHLTVVRDSAAEIQTLSREMENLIPFA